MRRIIYTLLLAMSTALVLAPPAGAEADLKALEQLYRKDPARAFEEAARLFQEPKQKGDLDGMVAIADAVAPWARTCASPGALDDMADAALPVARARGDWAAVGALWRARAMGARVDTVDGLPAQRRFAYAVAEAVKAYERAGRQPEDVRALVQRVDEYRVSDHVALLRQFWADDSHVWGARFDGAMDAIATAIGEFRDAEGVDRMEAVLRRAAQVDDLAVRGAVVRQIAEQVSVRGGVRLLPALRIAIASLRANDTWFIRAVVRLYCAAARAWDGRNDAFRATVLECYEILSAHPTRWPSAADAGPYGAKLAAYKRYGESDLFASDLLSRLASHPFSMQVNAYGNAVCATSFVMPTTPGQLRRQLIGLTVEHHRLYDRGVPSDQMRWLLASAPVRLRPAWALDCAWQVLTSGSAIENPEKCAAWLALAASLFDKAERKDLAEQTRAFSAQLARNDPKVLLQCALGAAQTAASEERWQDVVSRLQPVIGTAGASREALDATILLQQAKRSLGTPDEAAPLLAKAISLAGQVDLAPGERVNILTTLASRATGTQKTQLLEYARRCATEAGLEGVLDRLDEQLATAATAAGDLPTQKRVLLQICARQEAKRDRLAFDPLLRQQWFASTLRPYRKLLSVAARTNDALLALDCGERMRSRALADQLAWRKVDMAVRLPAALQQRLTALRDARRQAYGMLREAMGGSASEDDSRGTYIPIRGSYIPIRGSYIPIRGPLEDGKPANVDPAKLKALLAALAKEEAALESAIREAVPAYRMAAGAQIPAASVLDLRARRERGRVVLEYTLAEDGIVVVALAAGFQPLVRWLPLKPDEAAGKVERFRTALQERGDKAGTEAQGLYRDLITPVESMLAGAKELLIVADGALHLIPFAALQGKDGHALGERFAVSMAPSVTMALSRPTEPAGLTSAGKAVVFAAPDTGAVSLPASHPEIGGPGGLGGRGYYIPIRGSYIPIRGDGGESSAFTLMAGMPLPGAKAEGDAVAAQFPGALLVTGKEATKERLWQDGAGADVLHVATHGYADPEVPEFSGLLLAGAGEKRYDVLTAQEVYLWNLKARLVTLSACQTGLGREVEGEGVLGLTRAFLYAGAGSVVCSLWPVSDESTAKLMREFYGRWSKGATAEQALQGAQAVLQKEGATKHPFYWAGFVVVRGAR